MKEIEGDMRPALVEAMSCLLRWLKDEKQDRQPEDLLFMAEAMAVVAAVRSATESDPDAPAAQALAWQALLYLATAGLTATAPNDPLVHGLLTPSQGWAMQAARRIRDLRDTLGGANNTSGDLLVEDNKHESNA